MWRIKLTTEALFGDRKTERGIERKEEREREMGEVLSGQKLYVILSKKSKTRRNTYSTFLLFSTSPPRPSLSQLSAQRLRQNMPQSGCKTFSFIFKYKQQQRQRQQQRQSQQGQQHFRLCLDAFRGQLIDAHAGEQGRREVQRGRRREKRGGGVSAAMWVPYLLRSMIYYNFMHESVQSGGRGPR